MSSIFRSIHIYGGGTHSWVSTHFCLTAPAKGKTAKHLSSLLQGIPHELILTSLADPDSNIETNEDVKNHLYNVSLKDPMVKAIVFNVALCDFHGHFDGVPSGKYAPRLKTRKAVPDLKLTVADKLLSGIKKIRPDMLIVGFKATANETFEDQLFQGRRLLNENNLDIVLANDVVLKRNLLLFKEDDDSVCFDLPRAEALSIIAEKCKEATL